MPHAHNSLHRGHARRDFTWPDPKAVVSAIAKPFLQAKNEPKTITSVIYVTMAPTFTGRVAGYITGAGSDIKTDAESSPTTTSKPVAKETSKSSVSSKATSAVAKTSQSTHQSSLTKTPSSILSPTKSLESTQPLVLATDSASSTSSSAKSTSTSGSDSLSQGSTTPTGMSGGAKAGIAIGVVFGIGALLVLVWFFFRMRKQAAERERLDDEKFNAKSNDDGFAGAGGVNRQASMRTTRTASTAPRLSLRPVTQFLPNLGEKRNSRGNALQMASADSIGALRSLSPQPQNFGDNTTTHNYQNSRENPFGNHAEAVDPVNAAGPASVRGVSSTGDLMSGPGPAIVGATTAGAAAGGVAALKRGASKRGNGPQPFNFTKNNPNFEMSSMASPAGTDYSMSEAQNSPPPDKVSVAIAAAGGPQNSAVHRVQLDFKPSMEDELELRAGQLIRLLHEYDDGWALCIRLDRSQQGVVPRTCLSTRPVKPRPQGPNNGSPAQRGNPPPGMRVPGMQQGRPSSPSMNGQRPQSPAGGPRQGRPMTPTGRPMTPNGRPMTPTGRPMTPNGRNSPGPQQRQERRITPPGRSPMNPDGTRRQKELPVEPQYQAEGSQRQSPRTSPQNSISNPPARKPVPGQAL